MLQILDTNSKCHSVEHKASKAELAEAAFRIQLAAALHATEGKSHNINRWQRAVCPGFKWHLQRADEIIALLK